jgi:alpha-glucosidase
MKNRLAIAPACAAALLFAPVTEGAEHELRSPDGRISVLVQDAEPLRYGVSLDGRALVSEVRVALELEGRRLGEAPTLEDAETGSVDRWLEPVVRRKAARIQERYNELRLRFAGGFTLALRAYDDGVAHRFETQLGPGAVTVTSERASWRFPGDAPTLFPAEEGFYSHNERRYLPLRLSEIEAGTLASLPVIVDAGEGVKLALAESDVEDYPGLWFRGSGDGGLDAAFPPYPLKEQLEGDRDLRVTEAADYIAVTAGERSFPWRLTGIAKHDGELLTSSLVWLLASPSRVEDPSWIRPGKVAWDWWNANNLYGVDFEAGVDTETYRHYIDFAAEHGLDYVILDEGWYRLGDVLEVVPEMDIDELSRHAREKGVGLILWVIWETLEQKLEAALDQYAEWGVAGIKVDFMQRDDQKLMQHYHRVAREAAEREMLVDFHGSQRPVLLARTWPNLITTEGVLGLEHVKWSEHPDPEHDLTLPFTRMYLGPMDYTPGAMTNAARGSFASLFQTPMSQGTRCHQLALYVVFESPLQMLADSPSNYRREPDALAFLSEVPTVWDETRVLDAKLGDRVALARRSGEEWWVGALTDAEAREIEVDFGFLGEGRYRLEAWEDGPNAHRQGRDFRRSETEVDAGTSRLLRLAPGGGWAARLRPARPGSP